MTRYHGTLVQKCAKVGIADLHGNKSFDQTPCTYCLYLMHKMIHVLCSRITQLPLVLGVPRDATPEQIRKAYKRLALRHHPDRINGDEKAKAEANERFAQIAHAYEMLTRGPDEGGQRQYGQYQPDAADMAAGFGGFGGGFPQYQQQQPFVSPFMGGFGGGAFGSFGGMGDPFGSMFGGTPDMAFGGMGGNTSFHFTDPFDLFRQVFGSDAAFGRPMNAMGGGPSGPNFAGNGMFQTFMGGSMPMMNATSSMQGGGNFTSFTYSSSASTGGVAGPGGTMQSISTTTTIENGKTVTRTERTTINPDGTRQTVVDLTGDDDITSTGIDEQSVPRRLTMDEKRVKGKRKPSTTRQQTAPRANNAVNQNHEPKKRKFGEITKCLQCCFPTIRKRRRLDPSGSPARPG